MTPGKLLRLTEDALNPLVTAAGGRLDVGASPEHALHLLGGSAPGSFRVVLLWEGDEAVPNTLGSAANGRVAVILQQARGLHVEPGRDTHRDRAGEMPILDRAEQVSAWMRALRYLDLEGEPHREIDCHAWQRQSAAWLDEGDDGPARLYRILFQIGYALDPPSDSAWPEGTVVEYEGWVTASSLIMLHSRSLAIDATAAAVTVRLPEGAVSQRAWMTTPGAELTVTDDGGATTLYPGIHLDRPAVPVGAGTATYGAIDVTFPQGSRGVADYTAVSDLGPIAVL